MPCVNQTMGYQNNPHKIPGADSDDVISSVANQREDDVGAQAGEAVKEMGIMIPINKDLTETVYCQRNGSSSRLPHETCREHATVFQPGQEQVLKHWTSSHIVEIIIENHQIVNTRDRRK